MIVKDKPSLIHFLLKTIRAGFIRHMPRFCVIRGVAGFLVTANLG